MLGRMLLSLLASGSGLAEQQGMRKLVCIISQLQVLGCSAYDWLSLVVQCACTAACLKVTSHALPDRL